jgi:tRNA threonylcarbamoyl adenosine modification protein (Sua5/YciO/YrdC/YwlC family)
VETSQELTEDPRRIRIPDDTEQWDTLLEVGMQVVKQGDLVVVPTDTVYGVGCDPFNPSAVDKLFTAKGRGRSIPLPVLVFAWRQAEGLVSDIDQRAKELIGEFWPGPLTIVLREAAGINWDLGESRGTVAVRMPKQAFTLDLIERTGPLAVTSANRSGQPTPSTVPEIMEQLDEGVGVYFDLGELPDAETVARRQSEGISTLDLPSTIVDLTGLRPRLLRAGAIPEAEVERVLGEPLTGDGTP